MVAKKPGEPSSLSLERTRRRQLAAEEGARTMAEVEMQAIAVRKNMQRLRALRLAKEAEAPAAQPPKRAAPAKKPRRQA